MTKKMAGRSSQAVGLHAEPLAKHANSRHEHETDVLLIGGGIMSATLGTWLQELEPDWSITLVERMESVAEESS
uniref:malate:quinone oxidoreductase n=1 Tax=Serratia marcescens TaxID=615 RepID=UPI001652BB82